MNARQFAQEVKSRLETVSWPGSSGQVVFGSSQNRVRVVAGEPTGDSDIPKGFPWALVLVGSGSMDPDDPNLVTQQIRVICATQVLGDSMGQAAVVGGAGATSTASANRGAYEILERVYSTLNSLTGADGARILLSGSSVGAARQLGPNQHLVMAELGLSAICTVQASYSPPVRLQRALNGRWTWSGSRCGSRHDFLQYRLVRKSGTDPSTSPEDGSVVYTGASAEASVAATSGNTYTVFADYNSRGGSSVEGSSDPILGSYRTV